MGDRGVVTIAGGARKYLCQAAALALSVRRHNPGLLLAVLTDEGGAGSGLLDAFEHVWVAEPGEGNPFEQKLGLNRRPEFDLSVFIDSDCLVGGSLAPVFERVASEDSEPVGITAAWRAAEDWYVPFSMWSSWFGVSAVPVLSSGMFAWRRGEAANAFFGEALRFYREEYKALGVPMTHRFAPDEPALAAALIERGWRGWEKDPALHCTTVTPGVKGRRLDVLGGQCFWRFDDGAEKHVLINHMAGAYDHRDYRRERMRLAAWARTGNVGFARPAGWLGAIAVAVVRRARRGAGLSGR